MTFQIGPPARSSVSFRRCLLAVAALLCLFSLDLAAAGTGSYPRIGSVWWGENIYTASPSQAAQIQLFLGPSFTMSAANAVQASNPASLILNTINSIETTNGAPAAPSN